MSAFEGREYRAMKLHLTIGIQYAVYQVGLLLVLAVLAAALPHDAGPIPAIIVGIGALIVCIKHTRRLKRLGQQLEKQQANLDGDEDFEIA